jgi:hypothetical protein
MSLARLIAPAALLLTLASASVPSATAQPAATIATCQPSQGSLSFIGCSLAQQLGLPPGGANVTVVALKSDRELPTPDALRERVQSAVAAALGPRGAEAKGAERSRRQLRVELSVEKSAGVLRVTADVRRATGLWQRIRQAKPSAERHGFVEAPLDAELRALIPPPPLVVSEVLKLKAPERGIVALACGPLGSEGGQELALVSRGSVRVGRVVGRAFTERKRAAWSALSAVAGTPLREPIASAEITADGALRVGLTDRRDGLTLSRDLSVVARFEGLMPAPGGGCVERSSLGVSARFRSCSAPGPATGRTQPTTFDAVAGVPNAQVGRELSSGTLSGARPELSQAAHRVGAQLAMGDADSDGDPELAYSADTLDGAKDRLTLVTLQGNKLTPRFELPAPSISAVAICGQREGPGMAMLVLATGDELWLIR